MPPNPLPSDIVIAVFGPRGSGKSSFISLFTHPGNVPRDDHALSSVTTEVELFECSAATIPRFYMLDTPSFDDTSRSLEDIVAEVASWLRDTYKSGIELTGVLYTYDISQARISGANRRALRIFEALCGEKSMEGIVLLTTFWSNAARERLLWREENLRKHFWQKPIALGSKILRHDEGRISAEGALAYLINRRLKVVLDIQKDLVDEKKDIRETAVAAVLDVDRDKQIFSAEKELGRLQEELLLAIMEKDEEWEKDLREIIASVEQILESRRSWQWPTS